MFAFNPGNPKKTFLYLFIGVLVVLSLIGIFIYNVNPYGDRCPRNSCNMGGNRCFDADTKIVMQDGSHKRIIDLEIGDVLLNNYEVLGTMKFSGKDVTFLNNDGILSTPQHHVLHEGLFKRVSEIPNIQSSDKQVKYVYDLDTTDHRIVCLNDKKEHVVYTDYSEIEDKDDFIEKYELGILNNTQV